MKVVLIFWRSLIISVHFHANANGKDVVVIVPTMNAEGERIDSYHAGDQLKAYGDGSSVAGYAQGPVAGAIQKGWLPTRNGRLEPRAPLTRVEMAEMIHRVLTY